MAFFDALADCVAGGVSVFAAHTAGSDLPGAKPPLSKAELHRAHNRYLFTGRLQLCWQRNAIDWLERSDPTVVVAEANPRLQSTRQVVRWMHSRNRPVLGWGLGTTQLTSGFGSIRGRIRRSFLHQFDHLIAYSTRAAEQYEAIGIDSNIITVARNAVTLPAQHRPRREGNDRAHLAVLFVGQLTYEKRVQDLIRAAAEVSKHTSMSLTIVGEGPARGDLERLAATELPSARFTGAQRGASLEGHWQAADLFVLPGLGGLAIQEAMAYGLPIISAEADGTQLDLVRPGNGWIVPPNDVNSLTAAIVAAASDRARLQRMGEASLAIVQREVNIHTMRDAFLRAVQAACRTESQ